MHIFSAIEQRRSIKHFDPSFQMPAEDERRLMELALLSPTSFNIQNWRFVIVRDPALKKQVRAAAWNQAQIEEAQLTIALCADLNAWDKEPERYWCNAHEKARGYLVPMIRQCYQGKEQLQRDEAMRSIGIASQTLMLAAKALGYDSGALVGFDPDAVAKIINLPADHVIGMLLVIGKKLKEPQVRGGQLAYEEVVLTDRFPDTSTTKT
ncbi:MAG: nitroreductase family protein [Planctomycetia bacterium]|nr:nitroreductase family protein [Planctomycetia bacterium]